MLQQTHTYLCCCLPNRSSQAQAPEALKGWGTRSLVDRFNCERDLLATFCSQHPDSEAERSN